jgi:hypothetical protein
VNAADVQVVPSENCACTVYGLPVTAPAPSHDVAKEPSDSVFTVPRLADVGPVTCTVALESAGPTPVTRTVSLGPVGGDGARRRLRERRPGLKSEDADENDERYRETPTHDPPRRGRPPIVASARGRRYSGAPDV